MGSRPRGPERRKNSRSTNHTSLPYHRVQPATLLTNANSPGPSWEPYALGDQQLHSPNYFDLQNPTIAIPTASLSGQHGDGRTENAGPLSPFHPEEFFSGSPILHQANGLNDAQLFQQQLPSPDSPSWPSWGTFTPSTSNFTGSIDTPLSDGRYGSLDSLAWSTPNTLVSDISDGFPFSGAGSRWDSPVEHIDELVDQELPGGYFELGNQDYIQRPVEDPRYPGRLLLDTGRMHWASGWNDLDSYRGQESNFSEQTAFDQQTEVDNITQSAFLRQSPWTAENVDFRGLNSDAHAGNMAFAPRRGLPYQTYKEREKFLGSSSPASQFFSSEDSQYDGYNGNEPWKDSTPREVTPSTSDGESVQQSSGSHWHIFSAENGFEIPPSRQPRARWQTPEKKRQTLEVRREGACWACHLSKIRCSPCSPGSPCQKCASLMGRRRFCKLTCFNDTIESLHPFLIPDVLVGHFTEANVEAFVKRDVSRWGEYPLVVHMGWGSKRLITANVVRLYLREEKSEIGLLHQAIANGTANPTLVRQSSPPLGIKFAYMADLQKEYRKHVQDVVARDLGQYPSVAYSGQSSKLSERLLRAVCMWYQKGVAVGEKCTLSEEGIEIHIIETILGRSLILDETSIGNVQAHLGQEFARRSAPRCAQRQIKLAFFMLQRPRIVRVLEGWGKLMRTIADHNDKWATAICVFVLLTLLMDMLITSAYYMCEDNIQLYGEDPTEERRQFHELVRLMETQLFERCKEIFHSRFKTRKGDNDRFNPVRDGLKAWRKGLLPDVRTSQLVDDLRAVTCDFGRSS